MGKTYVEANTQISIYVLTHVHVMATKNIHIELCEVKQSPVLIPFELIILPASYIVSLQQ